MVEDDVAKDGDVAEDGETGSVDEELEDIQHSRSVGFLSRFGASKAKIFLSD